MRKSRVDIWRGKLARAGICVGIRDDMPEEVAASFIAEMRLCPDCAGAAAQHWRPADPAALIDSVNPALPIH